MKFLLNMNVPRKLGRRLTSEGHECRHVGDIGMAQVSDLRRPSHPKVTHPRRREVNYLSLLTSQPFGQNTLVPSIR